MKLKNILPSFISGTTSTSSNTGTGTALGNALGNLGAGPSYTTQNTGIPYAQQQLTMQQMQQMARQMTGLPMQPMQPVYMPQTPPKRRKTQWEKLLDSARDLPRNNMDPKFLPFYYGVPPEIVVEHFGHVKPVYAGRPKRYIMPLLNAATGRVPRTHVGFRYFHAGLTYTLPAIPGRRKVSFRLSLGGMRLLDHWAEKNPSFRPFVAAYLTDKARKEITTTCIDFELGAMPSQIENDIVLAEKLQQKIQEERKKQELVQHYTEMLLRKEYGDVHHSSLSSIGWQQYHGRTFLSHPFPDIKTVYSPDKDTVQLWAEGKMVGDVPAQDIEDNPGTLADKIRKILDGK